MSDEGRLVADRYHVIKRIGTGAMGVVWQAHDRVLHRTVAIKQLLLPVELDEHEAEEARQRTMREGRIAARLHHPNAISVFDVVTDDNGQPCLIMEYLESTSLSRVLQQQTTLPPPEVARIGTQIAAALKAAHAVGIVHRDVKPGNILLTDDGVAKITDFGISRANDDVTVTKTGMIAGTPAYLAPEVAIGGDPGPESDVFALGSTLYAATEGQPPFGLSENTLSLLHSVAAGQINPPRQSGALTSVLAVMLHPDVQHRPTADECAELLAAVARGETPLGETAEEQTQVHPVVQEDETSILGAVGGAAGAALPLAADSDLAPHAHSGTLGDTGDTYYGQQGPDEGYDPVSGHPGTGHEEHHQFGSESDITQVVPAGASDYGEGPAGYSDEDHDDGYYSSGYDEYSNSEYGNGGYASGGYDSREYDDHQDSDREDPDHDENYRASREEGDELDDSSADSPAHWSSWAVPAALGSLVVAGMAVFVIWLFGGSGGSDAEEPDLVPQHQIATTSTVSSTTTTSTSTESSSSEPAEPTTEATTTTVIITRPPEPPPPPNPEPTEDPDPTSGTTSSEPLPTDTSEPCDPEEDPGDDCTETGTN